MATFAEYTNKKKKKSAENTSFREYTKSVLGDSFNDDIAPVTTTSGGGKKREVDIKTTKTGKKKKSVGGGLDFVKDDNIFSDGYQVGDISKSFLANTGKVATGVAKGSLGLAEGISDALLYGASGVSRVVGADKLADKLKAEAKVNSTENLFAPVDNYLDKYSTFGRTLDAVNQGIGQVGTLMAGGAILKGVGLGANAISAGTQGAMGVSAFGSGMSEAYQGKANDKEALIYGATTGASAVITEMVFGGLGKSLNVMGFGKGLSQADDILAKKLSSKINNTLAKNLVQFGVKSSAEGLEEVLDSTVSIIAKKKTYMSEEDWRKIVEDENLLENFIAGAATSGMMQVGIIPGTKSGSLIEATKNGTDFITGYTQNEQKVVDKVVEDRIAEREADGTKISKKEKAEIEEAVKRDLEKGYLDTDALESVLGGETYEGYKSLDTREKTLQEEIKALSSDPKPVAQRRVEEAKAELAKIQNGTEKTDLKNRLSEEVKSIAMADRLGETYAEQERRKQKFNADLTKYDEKIQTTVQKAVESGILNNSNRTHEFVDMVAKLSADKGVSFDFTDNENLKKSGFALDGKTINGLVKGNDVILNVDSHKALNTVVGHEITHVLEGTELYAELQSAIKEYATTKGDYDARLKEITALYEGVEGANIDAEITADLIGDYLFTDSDFISKLSTEKPNIFKKIYEEIKYLVKVATAGSKEAKELEKVKRAFEKAYKESGKNNSETKYSVSDKNIKISVNDYHSGEMFAAMTYEQDGKVVGTLDYSEYEGKPNVKMVEVAPEYRRNGIGKKLLQELQRQYPDVEIGFGMTTPDGTKLLDSITYTQTDEKVAAGKQKLSDLQAELETVENRLNELYEIDELTAEQQKEMERLGDRWDELYHTEIPKLTEEYGDKSASKRLVKTDDISFSLSTEREAFPKTTNTMKPTQASLKNEMKTVRDVRSETMLKNNYTDSDVKQVNKFMDNIGEFMEKAGVTYKYIGLEDVNNAKLKVVYDKNGNPKRVTMSAMVQNGDYPVNFDFTSICKKRQSMSMVIKELAKRQTTDGKRTLDTINLDAKALWTINEELRKAGLETACLGCFVEAKRYNIQNFADKATKMWNKIVDEVRMEQGHTTDAEYFNLAEGVDLNAVDYTEVENIFKAYAQEPGRTSPETRMRALIKNGGETYQKYLQASDIMTPEGIEALKSLSTKKNNLYGIIQGVYGQAAPKEVMGFTPYNSEVALLPEKKNGKSMAKYIASIGGVRMQSFSDFVVANVYDYMQMVADLSARHLPAHAYTKEIAFAKIFGLTGIKINMSVMFDIDPNLPNEYAGLQFVPDQNGTEYYNGVQGRFEYLVGDKKRSDAVYAETGERPYVQSIGYDEAVELQNTEGYSKNVGIIGVGFSDKHIEKMLDDNNIRYVIPYHASSLPAVIKGVTNIAKAKDYTDYQNTIIDGKKKAGLGGFDIYADVEKTKNPRQTANNYLNWVYSKGGTPVFSDFAWHDNYYKMLFDFDPYDVLTGEYSPQTGVQNIYKGYNPSAGLTSTKELEGIIDNEMQIQNEANRTRNGMLPSVVDNVLNQLGIEGEAPKMSLSDSDDVAPAKHGDYNVYGSDIKLGSSENSTTLDKNSTVEVADHIPDGTKMVDVEEPVRKDITTPKERTNAELEAVQTELDADKQMREESYADFTEIINRLESEYAAKKNKNTKVANDILRRIERTKRLRDTVDADYSKRINDLETKAKRVKEGKPTTRQALHKKIVNGFKSTFASKGLDLDEVFKNAKNLSTFATVDNTPQRVMEKSLGYKEGQILSDLTVNKVAQNETEGIKWLNSYTNRKHGLLAQISKQYNIKPGSKESAAAQMYAEGFYVNEVNELVAYGDEELAKDFPDPVIRHNIIGLATDSRIRKIYDETLAMLNESRTRNAYPEIPRLDNYFLHFRAMDDTFSKLGLPFNPNDIRAKDLPTDLNGVTADLKPGQPYFASAMHRRGQKTSFDLLGGLERYLTSAKNQIYHIDDIQNLRALRNYIADQYGQANGLESLDGLTEEEVQDRIEKVYGSHLSTFAKFLNEEANILAGKTALIDRGLEGIIGRRGITFLNTVNGQVGSNMVGYNVSSSLTNVLPVVQTFAKTNKTDFVKAFTQTVSNRIGGMFGKSDGFADQSSLMIRRAGVDRFNRTLWQKLGDPGYALMGAVDSISSELIARTKYNEFVRKGMDSEKAHYEADKWASKLMGDRSLGQMPQLYNSRMLGLVTKFQLEVRNQLDSQFYDTIKESQASNEDIQNGLKKNAKTAAKVASTFVQLAVAQHLFGKAFESVAGYNPAFDIIEVLMTVCGFDDEEDSEDTVLDNVEEGFLALLEDLPYTSTLTGGRIPISQALPITELVKGQDEYGNEKSRWKTLGEIAPYYLLPGGYGQIKKSAQGLNMFSDEHPVAGSYTSSGNLRYPVEDTPLNRVQAGVFGQYANKNARDYFDNDRAPLKEKQIQEYMEVGMPIRDYWEYREGLSGLSTLNEKGDYIGNLDLPINKKNVLINNIADRSTPIDYTGYENYSNFEEFDFAMKNPDKYRVLQEQGVSVNEYKTEEEKTAFIHTDDYSWAADNKAKYTLSKAITSDVKEYKRLTKELNKIKADEDRTAKEKKLEYINGLNLDYGQKIILYRSLYDSKADKETYNNDIVDYLNSRDDISYEDMVTILQELDFTVYEDGSVEW